MAGVGQDHKVPISDNLDSDVPLVPNWGQVVPRTNKIPHVEVQAICAEWNSKGISKRKSTIGKLVPKLENPDDQMEGALEHPTKFAKNSTRPTRNQSLCILVYAGSKSKSKTSRLLPNSRRDFPRASSIIKYKIINTSKG